MIIRSWYTIQVMQTNINLNNLLNYFRVFFLFSEIKNTVCIKCPVDRTLVGKPGSDLVMLQKPVLYTCTGKRAPKSVRFIHMYGPRFGSLAKHGSHIIVGKILHKQQVN